MAPTNTDASPVPSIDGNLLLHRKSQHTQSSSLPNPNPTPNNTPQKGHGVQEEGLLNLNDPKGKLRARAKASLTKARKRMETNLNRPSNRTWYTRADRKWNETFDWEFGGPIGTLFFMIWSHYIVFYFWYCLERNDGKMLVPTNKNDFYFHLQDFQALIISNMPSNVTWYTYLAFFTSQIIFAAYLPGKMTYGVVTASGKRLPYLCNGYEAYYLTLILLSIFHYVGIFNLTLIVENFGEYLIAAVVIADLTSVYWYFHGLFVYDENDIRPMSGNPIYDLFMGTTLYPRIGIVDIKMIAECRWSWTTLFLIAISATISQYEKTGTVSSQILLMLLAHYLYSNATVKGEHFIPPTWDMFHERYGFMLNFWNIAGVPYLYCYQTLYVLKYQDTIFPNNWSYVLLCYIILIVGYYIFDSANCQKSSYKLPNIRRKTFPTVWWSELKNPKVIKTPKGALLVDGWYKYARKMQYTGDIMMALSWGMICGFGSTLPYFYCLFFTCMICHRQWRDEIRCSQKYGIYWDRYKKQVPYIFIPGLI